MAVFCAPGFLLTVKEQKSMPKRFCDGFLLQRYNPSQCHFSQKTALHAMHSYDRMCLWWHFARRGFPSLSESEKSYPSASAPGFCPALQSAAARFPRKPPRHAMRSYDQMHPLSPIARHILPFSASLSAWEARCDRICVQGDGRSPIASSILFRRDDRFAQVLRKSGVLLGTPAANE